jgi:hypothetical protein
MMPVLALSLSLAALACIGVIVWQMSVRMSAGDLRRATVSRAWLLRHGGGGRE